MSAVEITFLLIEWNDLFMSLSASKSKNICLLH